MRKAIVFIFLVFSFSNAWARKITIDVTDREVAIVENDIVDAEQWLKDAWKSKVSRCKSRIVDAEIKKSRNENSTIPGTDDEIVDKHFNRNDYKNRKQRDLTFNR